MDFAEKFYVPTGLSYSSQYQDQNNNLDDVVKVFFLDVSIMSFQLTLSIADQC